MLVTFGKHAGKSVGMLVLKYPDYIGRVVEEPDPGPALKRVKAEALRLQRSPLI